MPERRDQMGECNLGHHPIDTFTRECCANCINPECTRSLTGKAKFDHRTATWFERYFGEADKMLPTDARFSKIAGQKFMIIDPGLTGRTPEVTSAWLDPRDLERQAEAAPAPAIIPTAASTLSTPGPAKPSPPAAGQRQIPHSLLLANVPAQGGMVSRPPSANTAPVPSKDPWSGPVPDAKDEVPLVSPGARVKMGGGGV
jgi:hypothetical protein